MPLKQPHRTLDTFSMSSMTDVIFLLLIFFMVTSTLIMPAAVEVNLPQSSEQTPLRPVTEVYIDSESHLYVVEDRNDTTGVSGNARAVSRDELLATLMMVNRRDSLRAVALYADSTVAYARVVDILDMAARNNIKLVLATRSAAK